MKLKYCAWLSNHMDCAEESVSLPDNIRTVGMLLDWLPSQDQRYAMAFEFIDVVMVSVNKQYAGRDHPVSDDDEVMLVPPIAGG